jgi:hypothetical protein
VSAPLSYWWNHLIIPNSVTFVPLAPVRASRIAVFSRGICSGLNGWIHMGGHIGV